MLSRPIVFPLLLVALFTLQAAVIAVPADASRRRAAAKQRTGQRSSQTKSRTVVRNQLLNPGAHRAKPAIADQLIRKMDIGWATRNDSAESRSDLSVLQGAVHRRVNRHEVVLVADVTVSAPSAESADIPEVDDEVFLAMDGKERYLVRRTRFHEGTTKIPRAEFERKYGASPRLERGDGTGLPTSRLKQTKHNVEIAPHTVVVAVTQLRTANVVDTTLSLQNSDDINTRAMQNLTRGAYTVMTRQGETRRRGQGHAEGTADSFQLWRRAPITHAESRSR